jgi:hypothetical protein
MALIRLIRGRPLACYFSLVYRDAHIPRDAGAVLEDRIRGGEDARPGDRRDNGPARQGRPGPAHG